MDLSDEVILKDIAIFEERIAVAKEKLAALPSGQSLSWKERKKHQAKRREFQGEAEHVERLIAIARSALNPTDCQSGQP